MARVFPYTDSKANKKTYSEMATPAAATGTAAAAATGTALTTDTPGSNVFADVASVGSVHFVYRTLPKQNPQLEKNHQEEREILQRKDIITRADYQKIETELAKIHEFETRNSNVVLIEAILQEEKYSPVQIESSKLKRIHADMMLDFLNTRKELLEFHLNKVDISYGRKTMKEISGIPTLEPRDGGELYTALEEVCKYAIRKLVVMMQFSDEAGSIQTAKNATVITDLQAITRREEQLGKLNGDYTMMYNDNPALQWAKAVENMKKKYLKADSATQDGCCTIA